MEFSNNITSPTSRAFVMSCICEVVACKLGKTSVTIEEVDEIYDSGKYPEVNAEINYILGN